MSKKQTTIVDDLDVTYWYDDDVHVWFIDIGDYLFVGDEIEIIYNCINRNEKMPIEEVD